MLNKPANVALTTFIWFVEFFKFLVKISLIPAHSHTARTGEQAITPVPGAAGFSNTPTAPNFPTIW